MQAPTPVKNHPNATLTLASTPPVAFLVKAINLNPWIDLDTTTSIFLAGVILSFLLFVGKRGFKGCLDALWRGTRKDQT